MTLSLKGRGESLYSPEAGSGRSRPVNSLAPWGEGRGEGKSLLRRNGFQQLGQQDPVLAYAGDMHLLIRGVRTGNGWPD